MDSDLLVISVNSVFSVNSEGSIRLADSTSTELDLLVIVEVDGAFKLTTLLAFIIHLLEL